MKVVPVNSEESYKLSYQAHEKGFDEYARGGTKETLSKAGLATDTVDAWRHTRMYNTLDPLLEAYPDATWVTIGDGRYGKDAQYIRGKGIKALATDITDTLLKEALESGLIETYRQENSESLSFADREFDFAFCKESYHHFPRPMIALYEMLRVAKKGVVLIEPTDTYITSSIFEVPLRNLKNFIKMNLRKRSMLHDFEESGNYLYRISRREIEKLALGMNFTRVAFKGINDYYIPGVEYEKVADRGKLYRRVRLLIAVQNILCKLRLLQPGLLVAIIFKGPVEQKLRSRLTAQGFQVVTLPTNPYLPPIK